MAVDPVDAASGIFSSTISKLIGYWWIFLIVFVLIIIITIVIVVGWMKKTKGTWSIKIRLRQEDTLNNQIYLDPMMIKARRINLSNGLKMMLLEKPLLGKRLMPLLNYYTKPNLYDILILRCLRKR